MLDVGEVEKFVPSEKTNMEVSNNMQQPATNEEDSDNYTPLRTKHKQISTAGIIVDADRRYCDGYEQGDRRYCARYEAVGWVMGEG